MEKIPVTIDLAKWNRGTGIASYLRSPHVEKYCCLGFCALALGFSEDDIKGERIPIRLKNKQRSSRTRAQSKFIGFYWARVMYENDADDISDVSRMTYIERELNRFGFEVTWINSNEE